MERNRDRLGLFHFIDYILQLRGGWSLVVMVMVVVWICIKIYVKPFGVFELHVDDDDLLSETHTSWLTVVVVRFVVFDLWCRWSWFCIWDVDWDTDSLVACFLETDCRVWGCGSEICRWYVANLVVVVVLVYVCCVCGYFGGCCIHGGARWSVKYMCFSCGVPWKRRWWRGSNVSMAGLGHLLQSCGDVVWHSLSLFCVHFFVQNFWWYI